MAADVAKGLVLRLVPKGKDGSSKAAVAIYERANALMRRLVAQAPGLLRDAAVPVMMVGLASRSLPNVNAVPFELLILTCGLKQATFDAKYTVLARMLNIQFSVTPRALLEEAGVHAKHLGAMEANIRAFQKANPAAARAATQPALLGAALLFVGERDRLKVNKPLVARATGTPLDALRALAGKMRAAIRSRSTSGGGTKRKAADAGLAPHKLDLDAAECVPDLEKVVQARRDYLEWRDKVVGHSSKPRSQEGEDPEKQFKQPHLTDWFKAGPGGPEARR